jgi:large subunit ribosomal protein L10
MRKEKPLLLDEIVEKIDGSTALLVASYDKFEPNTSWQFRELLGKSGGSFEVVKKRLLVKAAEKSGIKIDETLLKGHVGVVFISQPDAMPSTKVVFKFSEENGNLLQVLCGHVDGKVVPGADLEALSKLPGLDEMRAMLLGLFTSPMSQVLAVMEAAIAGPLSVIEQKSES